MGPVKCYYHDCANTSVTKSMFTFPVNDDPRLKLWIKHSGNASLASLTNQELKHRFICEDHFKTDDVVKHFARSRLISKAVPLMCTPVSIHDGKDDSVQGDVDDNEMSTVTADGADAMEDSTVPGDSGDKSNIFVCHECQEHILKFRYVCVECLDYDLCGACEAQAHHAAHFLLRVPPHRDQAEVTAVLDSVRAAVAEAIAASLQEDEVCVKTEGEEELDLEVEELDPLLPIIPSPRKVKLEESLAVSHSNAGNVPESIPSDHLPKSSGIQMFARIPSTDTIQPVEVSESHSLINPSVGEVDISDTLLIDMSQTDTRSVPDLNLLNNPRISKPSWSTLETTGYYRSLESRLMSTETSKPSLTVSNIKQPNLHPTKEVKRKSQKLGKKQKPTHKASELVQLVPTSHADVRCYSGPTSHANKQNIKNLNLAISKPSGSTDINLVEVISICGSSNLETVKPSGSSDIERVQLVQSSDFGNTKRVDLVKPSEPSDIAHMDLVPSGFSDNKKIRPRRTPVKLVKIMRVRNTVKFKTDQALQ